MYGISGYNNPASSPIEVSGGTRRIEGRYVCKKQDNVPATKAPDIAVKKVNPASMWTPILRGRGTATVLGTVVGAGGTERDKAVHRIPK